jgi:hypothetical protein
MTETEILRSQMDDALERIRDLEIALAAVTRAVGSLAYGTDYAPSGDAIRRVQGRGEP